MTATMEDAITTDYINKEIEAAEKALEENEKRLLGSVDTTTTKEPAVTRLRRLEHETEDLLLAQEVAAITKAATEDDDMKRLVALGHLLCRQQARPGLYEKIYEAEYLPLYNYLNAYLVDSLRKQLKRSKYPSSEGCEELLRQCEENEAGGDFQSLAETCEFLTKVASIHQRVLSHVEGTTSVTAMDQVLLELCRPFVDRVKYHFVQQSDDAASRIERLPELLLSYLTDTVFGSAWELIFYGLAPHLALDFVNEIVRMIQWVLIGERNFFRHPKIAGPGSQPLLLCNAVEQLLQFDDFIRSLVPESQKCRIISLMDVCIAGDEELLQWWLERERESVYSVLFEQPVPASNSILEKHRVSPRAELFCALIRSIQAKAAVFSFSGPYLSQVASPLCVQFLDAIQESANDLRRVLTQRTLPEDEVLEANILSWIELINGTHMAASMLCANEPDGATTGPAEEDLARFGRSLERLRGVLVDECVTNVVEILLMERVKFAGYLMRCSHLLSIGEEVDELAELTDISPDLQETHRVLSIVLHACSDTDGDNEAKQSSSGLSTYAPRLLRDQVLSSVAEKLLEVALDIQGMTPDLLHPGCLLFARDVNALFSRYLLPAHALRVLDIVKLMSMDSHTLCGIGGALCGLSGRMAPLTEAVFEADDRLFDEAISMIRAKGLIYIELADVFAVLNRRRDL